MADKNKIMVVDDDEMNLKMAEFVLKKELDVEIVTANGGYQCIEILQQDCSFDLILLDIQMPRMDGIKTLEMIRKRDDWKNLPVIFLTASADKETVIKAGKLGVEGYIKKPFMPKDLVERVSMALATKLLQDPMIAALTKGV